jgi:DNA-binding transcriptional ArsR family regulator
LSTSFSKSIARFASRGRGEPADEVEQASQPGDKQQLSIAAPITWPINRLSVSYLSANSIEPGRNPTVPGGKLPLDKFRRFGLTTPISISGALSVYQPTAAGQGSGQGGGYGLTQALTAAQAELRRMVLDAVVSPHTRRNYGKPFGLTIEDIQKGISKLRNRVLGRVFQELGLIEQRGSGIQRMTAACHDRGLDAPRFEEIGAHFRVTLSAIAHREPATDARNEAILAALAASSEVGLSTSQIAKEIRLSPRAARTRLASLVERGLIVEIGSGPQDPRRRYHLASGKP